MKNDKETEKKVVEVLEGIRPYLQGDGGDVEFIKYDDGTVFIKLTGACHGCAFAGETIENGILASLQTEIPEVNDVILVDL